MGSDLASHAVQDGQKGSFLALFWRWAQSGRGSDQIAYPDQIIGGQREGEHPADPSQTTVASLAQAADSLDPAEDLLDPFAFLLANRPSAKFTQPLTAIPLRFSISTWP